MTFRTLCENGKLFSPNCCWTGSLIPQISCGLSYAFLSQIESINYWLTPNYTVMSFTYSTQIQICRSSLFFLKMKNGWIPQILYKTCRCDHFAHSYFQLLPYSYLVTVAHRATCSIQQICPSWHNPQGICASSEKHTRDLLLVRWTGKPVHYEVTRWDDTFECLNIWYSHLISLQSSDRWMLVVLKGMLC